VPAPRSPVRRRALLAACLLLAACAAPPPRPAGIVTRPPRMEIGAFSLYGRMAARRGDERVVASVFWQHGSGSDTLLFSGPLGQGLAELVRDPGGARLTLADGRRFGGADLEDLSTKIFGFALPVSDLARWIVGDAAGGEILRADPLGRPTDIEAAGWSIELSDWESGGADALPTRVELHRADIDMRVTIVDWQEVR